jgi:hypothetical protein
MLEDGDTMKTGLQLKYLWHDVDVYEFEVAASNGRFSGAVKSYVPVGGLAEVATSLEGFPRHVSDAREIQFGAFGKESAGGGVRLRFFCKNSSGHAVVELRFESEDESDTGSKWNLSEQTAHFFAGIEATAVDEFVGELRLLEEKQCGTASLSFTEN